jgi:hypothetical protein
MLTLIAMVALLGIVPIAMILAAYVFIDARSRRREDRKSPRQ